jgi:tRNA modification GTPase
MTDQALTSDNDTIVAIATPPGRGGVGILRLSGSNLDAYMQAVLGKQLVPRQATYGPFLDNAGQILDNGVAIYFPAPNSFTGEHVLELQGHGGPVVLDMLLQRVIKQGARLARPGEFSERAFLNDKMDLAQAEAIADLIDAGSEQAARGAMRSLQGEFSREVDILVDMLIALRGYVEAAIDFPEEEIDFLSDGKVAADLSAIISQLDQVYARAKQGSLMREGMVVAIAGRPNAGKSSLLNALAGREAAIVTDIEGTTRDVLREHIHIDGMPLHIIDTAGLRDSDDPVEQEGIRRAWLEIERADRILFVIDASKPYSLDPRQSWPEYFSRFSERDNISFVLNKVDLAELPPQCREEGGHTVVQLSAKQGHGLHLLTEHLKQCMGYTGASEGCFIARRRHISALEQAKTSLINGQVQLESAAAGELLAEDLRQAQLALGEITGRFTSDDLLGHIFSSFCIGK